MTFAQSGTLDSNFNIGTGALGYVRCSLIQNDGKIIIGGNFTAYNGTTVNRIARLNTDGTIDVSFSTGIGANHIVHTTSIQSDGKILIGGWFTSFNGVSRNHISRLNINGTIDYSFDPGTGANNNIHNISIQSDGKIIIGGDFTSYNGVAINRIARLNNDGTLDASFNPGSGSDGTVESTSIQNDGKIIIGGYFSYFDGTSISSIARLNNDGTLDPTFNTGSGPNWTVLNTSIQSDGKIIIVGLFDLFNWIARNHIARLNVDGSLDISFNPGTAANLTIHALSILSDGKIIIGGEFYNYNGITANQIARLESDGTLDSNFDSGFGVVNQILTIAIQSDNKIIIGGDFDIYNGIARKNIARLQNSSTVSINNTYPIGEDILFYPNPSNGVFTLQSDGLSNAFVNVYHSAGQLLIQQKNISGNSVKLDLSSQPKGLYIIEINQKSNSKRFKISKQ